MHIGMAESEEGTRRMAAKTDCTIIQPSRLQRRAAMATKYVDGVEANSLSAL